MRKNSHSHNLKISNKTDDYSKKIEKMRYKAFHVSLIPAGSHKFIAYSHYSGQTRLLSSAQGRLLLSCRSFDTLENHARMYWLKWHKEKEMNQSKLKRFIFSQVEKFLTNNKNHTTIAKKYFGSIIQELEKLAQQELLIPKERLEDEIKQVFLSNKWNRTDLPITCIGIPTCHRPLNLKKNLHSIIHNFLTYNRQPHLVVVDDTRNPEIAQQNRNILIELHKKFKMPIYYADRSRREAYARILAHHCGCPLSVTRFALLGDQRCALTTGAARNALLLHTTGELWVHLDDDIEGKILQPASSRTSIALTSSVPYSTYFTDQSGWESHSMISAEIDMLHHHELLLGKHAGAILFENCYNKSIDLDNLEGDLLKKLKKPNSKIGLTFFGTYGDAGVYNTFHRLFLNGQSFYQLVADEKTYRNNLLTRQVLRVPQSITITDHSFCMFMCVGVDNRSLMPPFMPVQRNSDGVFGILLRYYFPNTLKGFLPVAIRHTPPEERIMTRNDFFSKIPFNRVNDIMTNLIHYLSPNINFVRPQDGLKILGQQLMHIGNLPDKDFLEFIKLCLIKRMARQIASLEQRLQDFPDAPQYWQEDVKAVVRHLQGVIETSHLYRPSDLHGTDEERHQLLKELIRNFGQLLYWWQELTEAVKELKKKNEPLVLSVLS